MESNLTRIEHEQDYASAIADAQARLEHQFQLAQAALKGLMLVNGGAIIALFTFMGTGRGTFNQPQLWCAFSLFVAGLVCTLLATTLGFIAQGMYMSMSFTEAHRAQARMLGREPLEPNARAIFWGNVAQYSGIGTAFLALISFAVGSIFAIRAVSP